MHPIILKELTSCGLPWCIAEGTKHDKILIDGRFATILPKGKSLGSERNIRNVYGARASIRRLIKELKEKPPE